MRQRFVVVEPGDTDTPKRVIGTFRSLHSAEAWAQSARVSRLVDLGWYVMPVTAPDDVEPT